MEDKLCYERFKNIPRSNGSDEYLRWKGWIKNELCNYKQSEIFNLLKYYQIQLDIMEREEKTSAMTAFAPLASGVLTFMTINVSLFIAFDDILVSSLGVVYEEQIKAEEYMNIVAETLMDGIHGALSVAVGMFIVAAVILAIASMIDSIFYKNNAKRCVYYKELVEILQEILEEREHLKCKKEKGKSI